MEKKSKLKINSLKFKNFRNYDLLNLELSEQTNIFYGDNAQGKTNILESLYLCGTTKSHRGTKDKDMIQFGKDESHIEVKVEKRGITYQESKWIIRYSECRIFLTRGSEYYKKWSGREKKIYRSWTFAIR